LKETVITYRLKWSWRQSTISRHG